MKKYHRTGVRLIYWKRILKAYRPRCIASRRRETWRIIVAPFRWFLTVMYPGTGWHIVTSGEGTPDDDDSDFESPLDRDQMRRRTPPSGPNGVSLPALKSTSTMLNKTPLLREFLTATSYEDGTCRIPGYLTLRNRGQTFELTLYDPDSGCRMVACDPMIDGVLLLLETMLNTEEQLWQLDQYLTDQLAKRQKKRRA